MRSRMLIVLVVLSVLAFSTASAASITITYTVQSGFTLDWSLNKDYAGLVHYAVDWKPAKKGAWTWHVYKIGDNGQPDPAYECYFGGKRDKPGHWACTFQNAPAGIYISTFTAINVDTTVTETQIYCAQGEPCEYP